VEVDNSWVLDNESRIFTRIKGMTEKTLSKKFPGIYYTTSDELTENVTKPYTVYLHELNGVEKGQDLCGQDINGILSTFELKVSVNTKKSDCKAILVEILKAFKQLYFDVVVLPEIQTDSEMYIGIGRFRRVIGQGDSFD